MRNGMSVPRVESCGESSGSRRRGSVCGVELRDVCVALVDVDGTCGQNARRFGEAERQKTHLTHVTRDVARLRHARLSPDPRSPDGYGVRIRTPRTPSIYYTVGGRYTLRMPLLNSTRAVPCVGGARGGDEQQYGPARAATEAGTERTRECSARTRGGNERQSGVSEGWRRALGRCMPACACGRTLDGSAGCGMARRMGRWRGRRIELARQCPTRPHSSPTWL